MKTFNSAVVSYNSLIQQHKFKEALDSFYADEVVFSVNSNQPHSGIGAFRALIESFTQGMKIEALELVSLTIEKNLSVTNWYCALDHTKFGSMNMHYLSVQRWKNNKIIQHALFYDLE
ncbi:MAG TPA: nuclear transport factor 2 family protein [Cyclobacteriaceae bacterium]|nr:nuclear transport factor 2 family protein [Cyclobacteriaceae bacterium]